METLPEFNILEIVKNYCRRHPGQVVGYFFFSLASPIVEVVLPYFYGQVIQKLSSGDTNVGGDVTKIVGLWVLAQLMYGAIDKLDEKFMPGVSGYIRSELLKSVLYSYQELYEEPELGELVTRMVKLPQTVRDLIGQITSFVIPTCYNIIFALGFFFYVDFRLGSVALLAIIAFGLSMYQFLKTCVVKSSVMDKAHTSLNEFIEDALDNMITIFSSNELPTELNNFREKAASFQDTCVDTIQCAAKFKMLFNTFYFGIFGMVNGYSYYLHSQPGSTYSLSNVSSVLIVSLYLISTLADISGQLRDFVYNFGSLKQNQEYLSSLRVHSPSSVKTLDEEGIRFQGVSLPFGSGGFENVGVFIPKGRALALVGEIGSGKSTFVKLIMKYVEPQAGKVYVDGEECNSSSVRKKISYVPQHPKLFNRTVRENIIYGFRGKKADLALSRAKQILELLGSPIDLERKAGKGGSALSGGQRQLVVIIREILKGKPYLILDEPTSSLDEESKIQVIKLLKAAIPDRTTIIITHDPALLELVQDSLQFPL